MKKILYILSLSLSITFCANAQVVNTKFPALEAETIEDKVVRLPEDVRGRITLVGMAYSKKSEKDLTTWMNPVFNTFLKQKMNNSSLFASFSYDIDVYLIPMFTGVNAAAKGIAKRKAAEGLDSRLLPYILFYQGKLKPYKEALDFEKRDIPYFFLLDQQGKVIYATSGAYSDKKMEAIEDAISDLQ